MGEGWGRGGEGRWAGRRAGRRREPESCWSGERPEWAGLGDGEEKVRKDKGRDIGSPTPVHTPNPQRLRAEVGCDLTLTDWMEKRQKRG